MNNLKDPAYIINYVLSASRVVFFILWGFVHSICLLHYCKWQTTMLSCFYMIETLAVSSTAKWGMIKVFWLDLTWQVTGCHTHILHPEPTDQCAKPSLGQRPRRCRRDRFPHCGPGQGCEGCWPGFAAPAAWSPAGSPGQCTHACAASQWCPHDD